MSIPTRPRVCALLGPKKSGKTSILSVVLDDINPNSTVYNEPTRIPWTKRLDAFLDFEIWDMPGGMYELDRLPNFDIQKLGSVIFVIDAQAIQGDNVEQARKLANAIFRIHELNSAASFEIFIHKVDAMSPEYRNDTRQVISDGIKDELTDLAEMEFASLSDYSYPVLNYHLTSIYQASVYEALSKVISSLMPCQGALERLLDVLSTNSNFDKAWLFDLSSKLYFATDSTPGDAITHELCTEYIDLHWEMDQIYAEEQQHEDTSSEQDPGHSAPNGFAHHASKAAAGKKAIRSNFSGSVTLSNGLSLTHWELADDIALIARVGSSVLNQAPAIVESNVQHFREAVLQIRELEQER